ncbi:claudin-1 [Polymixia lowei]
MASSALQLLGFVLTLVGLGATVAATCMVEWRRYYEGTNTVQQTYEGLWMTCTGHSSGRVTCESYDSLLKLPSLIQVTRAVMLLSIFLSTVALMVSTIGMKCTRFMDGKDRTKSRVALVGGIMFMISGLMTLAVTSWYVRSIVQTFFGSNQLARYEFGSAVFVSWSGSILTLIGGAFLSWRCSGSDSSVTPPRLHPSSDYV